MRVLQNKAARPVTGVSFGPDGRTLVAGGSGGYNVWDLATSGSTFIGSHAVPYLFGCACDRLGRWLYVSDYRGGFRVLSLGEGDAPEVPGSPYDRHVRSFGVASSTDRLVMSRGGSGANRVECWELSKGGTFSIIWALRDGKPIDPSEVHSLNQSRWCTDRVGISPDGNSVVTVEARSARATIVLRDGGTGEPVAELGRSPSMLRGSVGFASDGGAIYAWNEAVLERWDVSRRKRTHSCRAPGRGYQEGVAVHPSGGPLITASGDGVARYFDPDDLTERQALQWGLDKLHSVAISPGGNLAAAGGDKGKVVVWDLEG